ncbi:hypothetical protein MPTK1_3g21980 [Marchantia polymorpha subsp. ruderalis]|uniref:Uncharacterized protein n=2 Tax=Marchantia polymorpha TaxID=3197 RepID=A0AAF6B3F1_MARPO|nr:hypothetical protein MARPO_0089s0019 [Marchantia polymorpha]BBN06535.1 hypothetical protein Mp_3g21980 [Marchantia polymorpha subsp. ruderalis]|eukprot:PTQ33384.1 hypothetical protein MARPO_0089s0019 [Marchantia polymorpha]
MIHTEAGGVAAESDGPVDICMRQQEIAFGGDAEIAQLHRVVAPLQLLIAWRSPYIRLVGSNGLVHDGNPAEKLVAWIVRIICGLRLHGQVELPVRRNDDRLICELEQVVDGSNSHNHADSP